MGAEAGFRRCFTYVGPCGPQVVGIGLITTDIIDLEILQRFVMF